ncbi:flagellar hook assembly protein FlgD [Fundidesulfovibrio butyratiphilus]
MSTTYTDYAGVSAGIIGRAETEFQTTTTSGDSSLGKDDFLKLLVTQLQAQDPLSPMDDKEFVAELSQFSSLEQLTNISTGISSLTTLGSQQLALGAVGFIGKDVKAAGDSLTKSGGKVGAMTYTLSDAASKVSVNIMDANGNIVSTLDLGAKAAGDQTFQWNGKSSNGTVMPDGIYKVGISAQKSDGSSMLVSSSVTGTVTGAGNQDGNFVLKLSDGRSVKLTDVQEVVTSATTS